MSKVFRGLARNSCAWKLNKAQIKQSNITYSIFACINRWCQLRLYNLSSNHFTSELFSPTSIFASASITFLVFLPHPLPAQKFMRNSNTASSPTSYDDLAVADSLWLPPRFLRLVFCHALCRLRRRPPFPLTFYIRFCHLCKWLQYFCVYQ